LEKKGLQALTADENLELPRLYQTTVSALGLARNIVLDKELLAYLENLCFRAYIAVYGPRKTFGEIFGEFILVKFPASVREIKWFILAAAILLFSGFAAGWLQVDKDLNNYRKIVPSGLNSVQISDTPEDILQKEIFSPFPGFEETFVHFANFLFRHNSQAAILTFALSLGLGIPTVFNLFANGEILGAAVNLHAQKGLLYHYLGFLSIHGITEILAILLAGGAGLSIAYSIFWPGLLTRKDALTAAGIRGGLIMVGVIMMLFVASILEGGFRHLFTITVVRYLIALSTLGFWIYYFVFRGKGELYDS
jgi:uncharacterized membrane protein SpoIIM required for sporulation